jgi:predicted enzyme related to lactoylglutathione lyase
LVCRIISKQPYFDEPFYVGFNIGGYELGLLPTESESEINDANSITYWGVDNIEESYNNCLNKGASVHEKPTNVGGELMVASVIDPWGNIIGLIYNPDFKLA